MLYENQQYVNNTKDLSIQIGNICHYLRGDIEYMSTDDYPEVAIISANLGKVEGLCRNLLQTINKRGDPKQLLRKIFRYISILIKYSSNMEGYVTFDDPKMKEKIISELNRSNTMLIQIDSLFNKAYSSFLSNESETPTPMEISNEVDFQGKYEFPHLEVRKVIKERNMQNISKLSADLREISIVCCNKSHQMQNLLYKHYSDMDSQMIDKINNICGQVENQTRAINSLFYKAEKAPSEVNDNQYEQGIKQLFNKLENIKNICTENTKHINMLNNKDLSQQLETYNNLLLSYSACAV